MNLGSWNIEINKNMPQKVASAIYKLGEKLLGAQYSPIVYLGYQQVNGINHAVLAEQLVTTGRDTKNVVILIFNEKPNEMEATLVSIDRVLESGGSFGGIEVNVNSTLSPELEDIWNKAFEGFVGSKITPIALLGTQVTKGTDYIFAATVENVGLETKKTVALVTVKELEKNVSIVDLLQNKHEASLGYAFTWI